MSGRELIAALFNLSDRLDRANGGPGLQQVNVEVVGERRITANQAAVTIRDAATQQQDELKLVREGFYWKIHLEDPNAPVYPLEKLLQNGGLRQPGG